MKTPLPNATQLAALGRAISDAKAPWAVAAIVALALILSACAVDQEKVGRTRADLNALCQGAITLPLKAACERAGVDTTPSQVVP